MHRRDYFQGTLVTWLPDSGKGTVKSDDGSRCVSIESGDFPPATIVKTGLRLRFTLDPETHRAQGVQILAPPDPAFARPRFGEDDETGTFFLALAAFITAGFWLFLLLSYPLAVWLPVILFSCFALFQLWREHRAWQADKALRRRVADATLLRLSALGGWPGVLLARPLFAFAGTRAGFGSCFAKLALINLTVMIAFAALLRPLPEYRRLPYAVSCGEAPSPTIDVPEEETPSPAKPALTLESLKTEIPVAADREAVRVSGTESAAKAATPPEHRIDKGKTRCLVVLADFPALHLAEAYADKRLQREAVGIYFTVANRFVVTHRLFSGAETAARPALTAAADSVEKRDCLSCQEIIKRFR